MHRIILSLLCSLCAVSAAIPTAGAEREPVIVFAAASLTDAGTEIAAAFTEETGIRIRLSFAASSVLARQIEAGAAAEVFFPADEDWMDYLEKRGELQPGSRRDVVGNRLVLIGSAGTTARARMDSGEALLDAIGDARVATADPDSVPAGRYARAALMHLGAWDQLERRLIRAENVRLALAYVARGEAQFGIVYLTDARIERNVQLIGTFPEESHAPIRYPVALTRKADAGARQFVLYLVSEPAMVIFRKYGFVPLR